MAALSENSSLADWLSGLERLSPREVDLGLERVGRVFERMRLAQPDRLLTVGGTNGKGSSVAMLAEILRQSGRRVGSYTSPHVLHYCERVRLDGQPIGEDEMVAAFAAVEAARLDEPLTYFEFGTLAALHAFAARRVDAVVLEVGLGGRLDAVNIVDPDGVLITNVSLDHREWLGDDVESIAREKAGIMRAGKPAVFAGTEVPSAIRESAGSRGASLLVAGEDYRTSDDGDAWSWHSAGRSIDGLTRPALGGRHQIENAGGVLALLEAVGETEVLETRALSQAFASLRLPGRQQRVVTPAGEWLLDGAHNEASAKVLADTLRSDSPGRHVVLVLGVLADKDVGAIVNALAPAIDTWIACAAQSPRTLSAARLAAQVCALTGAPCRIEPDVVDAMSAAAERRSSGALYVVAGSFYTVSPALAALGYR